MPETANPPPPMAAFSSEFEEGLCACLSAPAQGMAVWAEAAALQADLAGRMALAALAPWSRREAAHALFELDFLLGRRGEERPFPE